MKRIDVFMPPLSNYSVLQHFTKQMHAALQNNGITSHLLEADKNAPELFLKSLFEDPPECTLSFNGLLPDDKGNFLSDMINIPHVACLVDSPNSFTALTHSKNTIITCSDKSSEHFFQGLGFNRTLFMPQGVERSLTYDLNVKRDYDVVVLASSIDYNGIRSRWLKKFSPSLQKAMDEAVEIVIADRNIPVYLAFVKALDRLVNETGDIDPEKIDFISILDELEAYISGKDRLELIKSIDEAKVDIFGASEDPGWRKYLDKKKNIQIHDPVPFEQALEIMKHSKIVLSSSPTLNYGVHERVLFGLACGALVITNENAYLQREFKDGESIVFYQLQRWDKANHRVNEYLADNSKRERIVAKGREIVMKNHTWDHRARQLIEDLPPLLNKLKSS